jgi:hypothetical protein
VSSFFFFFFFNPVFFFLFCRLDKCGQGIDGRAYVLCNVLRSRGGPLELFQSLRHGVQLISRLVGILLLLGWDKRWNSPRGEREWIELFHPRAKAEFESKAKSIAPSQLHHSGSIAIAVVHNTSK